MQDSKSNSPTMSSQATAFAQKEAAVPQMLLPRRISCDSVVRVASFVHLLPLDGFFIAGCRKIKP